MGSLYDPPDSAAEHAKALRRQSNPPERVLWSRLRNRQLDGWGHNMGDNPERDQRRDAFLLSKGVRTLRIPARKVMENIDDVMWTILGAARA